jgi:hypothetical protein
MPHLQQLANESLAKQLDDYPKVDGMSNQLDFWMGTDFVRSSTSTSFNHDPEDDLQNQCVHLLRSRFRYIKVAMVERSISGLIDCS